MQQHYKDTFFVVLFYLQQMQKTMFPQQQASLFTTTHRIELTEQTVANLRDNALIVVAVMLVAKIITILIQKA